MRVWIDVNQRAINRAALKSLYFYLYPCILIDDATTATHAATQCVRTSDTAAAHRSIHANHTTTPTSHPCRAHHRPLQPCKPRPTHPPRLERTTEDLPARSAKPSRATRMLQRHSHTLSLTHNVFQEPLVSWCPHTQRRRTEHHTAINGNHSHA